MKGIMKPKGYEIVATMLLLLISVMFVPAVSAIPADIKSDESDADKVKYVNDIVIKGEVVKEDIDEKYLNKKDGNKIIENSEYTSKHEIILSESKFGIMGLSEPNPSTEGITLIGSDSSDKSNNWGSLLHSYRIYTVDNEEDPDYDYYVVWVQATGRGSIINRLNTLWAGIKNIKDGEIVDWSPTGTINIDSDEETTISLGLNVGAASASISQTFNDPSGRIFPSIFTTTHFRPLYSTDEPTYDPAFSTGGTLIKSPAGKEPTFTWYAGLV
ncbi:MAG: hypothetical protein K8R25_11560 [Methanosarcinales archaeon]|nr:hypothetical protein [Methanosarcinales archaeon]